jgi:hypothetical protein
MNLDVRRHNGIEGIDGNREVAFRQRRAVTLQTDPLENRWWLIQLPGIPAM